MTFVDLCVIYLVEKARVMCVQMCEFLLSVDHDVRFSLYYMNCFVSFISVIAERSEFVMKLLFFIMIIATRSKLRVGYMTNRRKKVISRQIHTTLDSKRLVLNLP